MLQYPILFDKENPMIKFVFLDLDDTLLDFHKAEKAALSKSLVRFGISPEDNILDRYHEINKAQWERLERGELTREQVKTERYRILFSELGVDISPSEFTHCYEEQLGIGHWFVDGAEELLKALYGKYHLFIASNGALKVQNSRLDSAEIKKYFDSIFISEQIGCNKPDKEFFDKCFSKIPCFDSSRAVMIGDSLTSDIRGGKNAGIKTVWFNQSRCENHTDITPDFEVSALSQIPDLLKNM